MSVVPEACTKWVVSVTLSRMGKAMKGIGHRAKVFSGYLHGVLAHLPHPLAERENLLNGKDSPRPRAQARNELKRERRARS